MSVAYARPVRLDAIPELGPSEEIAVHSALEQVDELAVPAQRRDENAWRRAALLEAAHHDVEDQALSPRRTRGATRA